MVMGSGAAAKSDAVGAAEQACDAALQSLGDGSDPDLVLAFVSRQHANLMGAVGDVLHRRLAPGLLLAVSGEGVIGGRTEYEGRPAVSLLAARLPGAQVLPFTSEDLPVPDDDDPRMGEKFASAIGAGQDLAAILLFADPFSTPLTRMLPALSAMCRDTLGLPRAPIIGGIASAGQRPGENGLVVHKRLSRTGAIGAVVRGDIDVDVVVSQGCRPFGPQYVVTGAKHNALLGLGGKPALRALQEAIESLPPAERQQLDKGVFLGRVINEYKDRFGRGDYLIRKVIGVEQTHGALAVADALRVGQTVRFHMRDAVTASEDLRLLLSAQRLREPALGAMLITCNGRGTRLFDRPDHDAEALCNALTEPGGLADEAPPTEHMPGVGGGWSGPTAKSPPVAGFFAGGEIGPVGAESFLHGHTACAAIFRSGRRLPDAP